MPPIGEVSSLSTVVMRLLAKGRMELVALRQAATFPEILRGQRERSLLAREGEGSGW